ncbi:hypothetical protein FRB97_005899 [Tulasnella sp. 331]|nr:hypothetical protein FRB97_005899 [Tulasnella sp. 331]
MAYPLFPQAGPPPHLVIKDQKAHGKAIFLPPSSLSCPLPLPLCIPQSASAAGKASPFLRAYNNSLADSGVSRDDWLAFIDDLVSCFVDLTLRVIEMPDDSSVATLSIIGPKNTAYMNAFLSKALTERFLRNSNESYFALRGLRVHLCSTTSEMHRLVKPNSDDAPSSSTFSASASTLAPTVELSTRTRRLCWIRAGRNMVTRLHLDTVTSLSSSSDRGMAEESHDCTLPLDTDVPPPKIGGIMGLGARLTEWKGSRVLEERPKPEESEDWPGGCKRRRRMRKEPAARVSGDRKDAIVLDDTAWIVLTNADQGAMLDDTKVIDSKERIEHADRLKRDWGPLEGKEIV